MFREFDHVYFTGANIGKLSYYKFGCRKFTFKKDSTRRMTGSIDNLLTDLDRIQNTIIHGRVVAIQGMLVEISGVQGHMSVGDRCELLGRRGVVVPCEIVGFRDGCALGMPFSSLDGIGLGSRVELSDIQPVIYPNEAWLGRVVNGFGESADGKGPLSQGTAPYLIRNKPPPAHTRLRVGGKLDLGVRSVNTFLTCCRGQRMGIFSGSGVGKSILLSMLARFSSAEVIVFGLIGERGRELQEFIEDDLGQEGLSHSVVVAATSDESALLRRQSAYITMAVAEYFRDQGKDVLCLMDSVTRFAMAQREIGLSAGEPPASKGYTPTVFAELPKLLERAGPGVKRGSITGLFTVLVEGDDDNEPVSDAVRGILDGHVVLDRAIAHRNRFPAVNILRSVSRTMPDCNTDEENMLVNRARNYLATYEDMAELIRIGAYRQGSDATIDEAIRYDPALDAFFAQGKLERTTLAEGYDQLRQILDGPPV